MTTQFLFQEHDEGNCGKNNEGIGGILTPMGKQTKLCNVQMLMYKCETCHKSQLSDFKELTEKMNFHEINVSLCLFHDASKSNLVGRIEPNKESIIQSESLVQ